MCPNKSKSAWIRLKKCIGITMGIAWNKYKNFGKMFILIILHRPNQEVHYATPPKGFALKLKLM